jgi:uncharacterized membrane protein
MTHPGEPTEFNITLIHGSDIPDDIKVTFEGPDDWYVELITNEFHMEPMSNISFPFVVAPPYNVPAASTGMFILTAYIEDMPHIKDTVTLHITVLPCQLAGLSVDPPFRFVNPGNSTDFDLVIYNYCGGPRIFVLEIMSGVGDWNVYLDRTSVFIADENWETIKLTVIAPEDALPGTRGDIKVSLMHSAGTLLSEAEATVFVGQIHDVEVETGPLFDSIDPGDEALFQVNVTNNGNGKEILDMSFSDIPDGWQPIVTLKDDHIDTLALEPGETANLIVRMDVPLDELAGVYDFDLGFSDYEEVSVVTSMSVTVNTIHAIEITPHLIQQSGHLEGTASYPISIKNVGNGQEIVSLSIGRKDLPKEWNYSFRYNGEETDLLVLDVRETKKVLLDIVIPTLVESYLTMFRVIGTLSNGREEQVTLGLNMEMADLEISSIRYNPIDIKRGKRVLMEVTVLNKGNLAARDVVMAVYVDNRLLDSETMDLALPNSTIHFFFEWTPERSEDYVLRFIVDPDDDIIEGNEENNKVKDRVRASSDENIISGLRIEFWFILGVISSCVLMAAAIKIYMYYG